MTSNYVPTMQSGANWSLVTNKPVLSLQTAGAPVSDRRL